MDVLSFGLIALASLLALVPFLDFLATRTSVALPVLAAAVGLITGLLAYLLDWSPLGAALDTYDAWFFGSLALTPESVIYIFLPPLLFEMTLGVDIRKLRQDLVIVATMAVFAVVVSTAAVGGLLAALSGYPLVACLLLGATVSTTDPAAVVTIFRRIGAPRRLLVVLEGESLLNDAAAIALFALLVDLATHGGAIDIGAAAKSFLYLFSAGALCGFALGYLGARLMPLLRNNPLAQTSLTGSIAIAPYLYK